jgi:serine/threonine protein kinase
VDVTLEQLVIDGLLTRFQASEVADGRGSALWLGGYRVLDRLGKGGMGSVFLAEHPVLGRRVAVKVLSDSLRADPGARRRFVREARAAAALDHPNIVHVFDVNMTHDPPYLVMEYVDGINLQLAVAQSGTFSVGETAAVGVQVADGLIQASAVGLVHRDIKPANLLVDRRGAVKILDLGIVRFTHDDTFSRVHGAEYILGTVDYLAPEQAVDSSKVDSRADIYGLGATLYFLLAGHPPYPIADPRRKLTAKQTIDPPPIHQLRPDVPQEFSEILRQLMARDPSARSSTPASVVAALHPWVAPGNDFPARLFRMSSDSTAHGRRLTDHEPREPLPETIIIVKGTRRSNADSSDLAASNPPPSVSTSVNEGNESHLLAHPEIPPTDIGSFLLSEADTQNGGGGAALTDEALALPAEVAVSSDAVTDPAIPILRLPLAAEEPAANPPQPENANSQTMVIAGFILLAVALGAVGVVLAWLVR